jgi:hypothetical protein
LLIAVELGLTTAGCLVEVGLATCVFVTGERVAVAVGVAVGSGLDVSVGAGDGEGLAVSVGAGEGLATAVGSWLGAGITTTGCLSLGPAVPMGWLVRSSAGAAAAGGGAGRMGPSPVQKL